MPCKICGNEGPLDERGFCATCAAKLAKVSESSSGFRLTMPPLVAASAGPRNQPEGQAAPSNDVNELSHSRVVIEFGQSEDFALRHPFSVATDSIGNILVMDRPAKDRYRVVMYSSDGEYLKTVLECEKGSGPNELKLPKGIAVDQHGNIYVPDSGNSRIQRFDSSGGPLGPIGGLGSGPGELDFPCDVDVDDAGALYIADTCNCRIQRLTPQGVQLLSIGSTENESDGGAPQLDEPLGVTVDTERNIYVADTNHHRVVKFSRDGEQLLSFGVEGTRKGELTEPSDVRVTEDGTIYVADLENSRVQKFDAGGNVKAEFRLGTSGEATDHGGDVAIDSDGLLIICNPDKHMVAKVEWFDFESRPLGE